MKVLAINGSPRKDGNTYNALKLVADVLISRGIDVEILHIGNKLIRGCLACGLCSKNRDEKCGIKDDEVNTWIQLMKNADGILLGSPVYYSAMAGTMKSFLDRAFYVAGVNDNLFRHKIGAAVVAVRRSGGLPTYNQLNNYLNYSEMVIPTSNYWNVIHGTSPGEVLKDDEGIQIMQVLGKNMAWLMEVVNYGRKTITPPEKVVKTFTNFIR